MSETGVQAAPQAPTADRPEMEGYGIDRSVTHSMLSWEWARDQLERSRNYWISTTRPDGRPHVMPVWGVAIDGVVYFGSGRSSRRARNLAHNPAVVVHLESGDEAVIVEGIAEEVTDREELAAVAERYRAKYDLWSDPDEGSAIYAVRPRVAFGWLEKDYPNTATRWRFSA